MFRARHLLLETASSGHESTSDESDSGNQRGGTADELHINTDYARRFEHNRCRSELHRRMITIRYFESFLTD